MAASALEATHHAAVAPVGLQQRGLHQIGAGRHDRGDQGGNPNAVPNGANPLVVPVPEVRAAIGTAIVAVLQGRDASKAAETAQKQVVKILQDSLWSRSSPNDAGRQRSRRLRRRDWTPDLLLAPALVAIAAVMGFPLVYLLYMSLHKWSLVGYAAPAFIGHRQFHGADR